MGRRRGCVSSNPVTDRCWRSVPRAGGFGARCALVPTGLTVGWRCTSKSSFGTRAAGRRARGSTSGTQLSCIWCERRGPNPRTADYAWPTAGGHELTLPPIGHPEDAGSGIEEIHVVIPSQGETACPSALPVVAGGGEVGVSPVGERCGHGDFTAVGEDHDAGAPVAGTPVILVETLACHVSSMLLNCFLAQGRQWSRAAGGFRASRGCRAVQPLLPRYRGAELGEASSFAGPRRLLARRAAAAWARPAGGRSSPKCGREARHAP